MGPRPLPGRRGEEKALIAEVYQVSANHTGLVAPPEFSDVGTCAFHSWPVRAALENREAYRSGSGWGFFLGWPQIWRSSMVSSLGTKHPFRPFFYSIKKH